MTREHPVSAGGYTATVDLYVSGAVKISTDELVRALRASPAARQACQRHIDAFRWKADALEQAIKQAIVDHMAGV